MMVNGFFPSRNSNIGMEQFLMHYRDIDRGFRRCHKYADERSSKQGYLTKATFYLITIKLLT